MTTLRLATVTRFTRTYQKVTLGALNDARVQEAVLGTVTIGDEVRIGPNVVVMTDVPAGATVFVNPACASVR